ncbi:hypothetical protein [Demequina zhanjiangensis]|uniref:Uncharacterized protein n=1 Tax=Demequina zhanjiangensis TaxID=3051659 RepID=A0ABT8FYR3_9MICO|nr:hypothetical protein [Demequina sp. SYSU T00b26]MDN4472030.1 hypothetical protein [Demequina sp. SYSU T00b26]
MGEGPMPYTSQSYKPWYRRVYGGLPVWGMFVAALLLAAMVAYAVTRG